MPEAPEPILILGPDWTQAPLSKAVPMLNLPASSSGLAAGRVWNNSGVLYAVASGGGSTTVPVTTIAASGSSRALAFPASGNAAYDITLTANCAVTLTGGTAGQYQTITLVLRQDATAGRTPTLPDGVKWPGGTAPTPNTTAGNIDVFTFSTPDARATVIGGY